MSLLEPFVFSVEISCHSAAIKLATALCTFLIIWLGMCYCQHFIRNALQTLAWLKEIVLPSAI
jgi:hypothetical protein